MADGEVESFKLIPVRDVANVIKRTNFFKSNCNIVIIDFLFRHGYNLLPSLHYNQILCTLEQKTLCLSSSKTLVFVSNHCRYITPEYFGYLDLLQSLKSGDCS